MATSSELTAWCVLTSGTPSASSGMGGEREPDLCVSVSHLDLSSTSCSIFLHSKLQSMQIIVFGLSEWCPLLTSNMCSSNKLMLGFYSSKVHFCSACVDMQLKDVCMKAPEEFLKSSSARF